ncbi:MAG: hypothetical protein J7L96_04400, partial [Bacteroidales bacterium]|nr:hypothetical protein [Bacteroidales bacterium]
EKYARGGLVPVWEGMWGSTILLFPLSIFLTYKSTQDSSILVKESYYILIDRILTFFKKITKHKHEDPAAKQ